MLVNMRENWKNTQANETFLENIHVTFCSEFRFEQFLFRANFVLMIFVYLLKLVK